MRARGSARSGAGRQGRAPVSYSAAAPLGGAGSSKAPRCFAKSAFFVLEPTRYLFAFCSGTAYSCEPRAFTSHTHSSRSAHVILDFHTLALEAPGFSQSASQWISPSALLRPYTDGRSPPQPAG